MGKNQFKPRIVIVGAGFGGLWAARALGKEDIDVLVVDHNNYHTFLALLYQVAAAELDAEDIAYPVRSIFSKLPNINFILAHVHEIDSENRFLQTDKGVIPYDYLILATGSVTHYFNTPGAKENTFPLKTLEEAVALKNHIICCFETAAHETNKAKRQSLLTFVIVGGGATGIEYAGALSELIHGPLIKDYRFVDFDAIRIILVEAADKLVAHMPEVVGKYAVKKLSQMGVDVRLLTKVKKVNPGQVVTNGQESISTKTVIWSAGVGGEQLPQRSGIPVRADGRVSVANTLQVVGHANIYVIGDLAAITEDTMVLPMVAQVAIQSGVAAARNILRQITGRSPLPFQYHDRGSMITIGRKSAGVVLGSRIFTGFFAWILWLFIHLFNLIGFRNRMMVLINWAWDYILYERAVRFVFPSKMSVNPNVSACGNEDDSIDKRADNLKYGEQLKNKKGIG